MFDFMKGLFGSKENAEDPTVLAAPALPALPQRTAPSEPPPPPPPPKRVAERIQEGTIEVDFVAVLDEGSLGAVDQDRIKRAQSLLETLPTDAPAGLKRRIVEAAFSVFDVPTSKIIEASSTAIDVIHAYVKKTHEATERSLADSEDRIAKLEASIRDERAAMARAKELQRQREELAAREVESIEPIVRFFTTKATLPPAPMEPTTPRVSAVASMSPKPRLPSKPPTKQPSVIVDEDLTSALEERSSSPPEPPGPTTP